VDKLDANDVLHWNIWGCMNQMEYLDNTTRHNNILCTSRQLVMSAM